MVPAEISRCEKMSTTQIASLLCRNGALSSSSLCEVAPSVCVKDPLGLKKEVCSADSALSDTARQAQLRK